MSGGSALGCETKNQAHGINEEEIYHGRSQRRNQKIYIRDRD